jgi:hypothetical protein
MTIFGKRSDDAFVTFAGPAITQQVVTDMLALQGLTIEFMDEETWKSQLPQQP